MQGGGTPKGLLSNGFVGFRRGEKRGQKGSQILKRRDEHTTGKENLHRLKAHESIENGGGKKPGRKDCDTGKPWF